MSYMRGRYYVCGDGERIHLWAADGADNWADSGWALHSDGHGHEGLNAASGVSIPVSVMDELVVMRFAEIVSEGNLEPTVQRILETNEMSSNVGSYALRDHANSILSAIDCIPRGNSSIREDAEQAE